MNRTSLAVLIGRAFSLLARHPMLYTLVAVGACAAEWLVYRYFKTPAVLFSTGIVVSAVVDGIVFARAKADVDGWTTAQMWDRVLERLWAVVIVSFIFTYVAQYGIALVIAGDIWDRILGIPLLLIASTLVFAEAVALVADEEQWWFLVVRALGTSIRTAWTGATMGRAITLFMLQLVPIVIVGLIVSLFSKGHAPAPSFWTDVPLGILFSIPLDVLIVLAFFDASGYEPNRTCGE